MTKPWSPPSIKPFERLQVTDGLLMNAQRWRMAHEYHRQRQNVQYQSLNQPGIVCGLGVCIIPPPSEVRAQYRDGRWLQIQPGIAIDLYGNFIIVTEADNFRIVSENRQKKPLTVYLTISFVDPEKLRRRQQGELVRETFRIDEKTSPPSQSEVELCRIVLPPCLEENNPAPVKLENPIDVFVPKFNNLDLRYRQIARSRSPFLVRVGQINQSNLESASSNSLTNLSYLLQSVEALYPTMGVADEIGEVNLETALTEYDLLYIKSQQSLSLTNSELETLKAYLETGGVLLVDIPTKGTKLEPLIKIKQQLEESLTRIDIIANEPDSTYQEIELTELAELAELRPELEAELNASQSELDAEIDKICLVFREFAQKLGTPLENLDNLIPNHPLRTQPFLFSALPDINKQPIQILLGGGIVIVIGELSAAWGLDKQRNVTRETIRAAQEMGINLLHFAWRKRQITPLQQQENIPVPPAEKTVRSDALKSVLDKL
ncbi:MAG: DUF4159 domain-containing protein [Potamolinea sp.]